MAVHDNTKTFKEVLLDESVVGKTCIIAGLYYKESILNLSIIFK